MGFDLKHQQEQQSLQRDGIHNLEILSPSNIEDFCSPPISLKSPACTKFEANSPGMMWSITGMNESSPHMVIFSPCLYFLFKLLNLIFFCVAKPIRSNTRKQKHQKTGYWGLLENRRTFLLEFAKKMGYDPMIKAQWKGRSPELKEHKVLN